MPRERYSPEQQAFYRAYINSEAWRERKAARISKAGGRCEWETDDFTGPPRRCVRTRWLCVHHNTYERLGVEQDGDLDVLCYFHHMLIHCLWQRCACGQPCLENEERAERWLEIVFRARGLDLDSEKGGMTWSKLPNKELLLDEIPPQCPQCLALQDRP